MTIVVVIVGIGLVLAGLAGLLRLLVLSIRQPGVAEIKLPWGVEARLPVGLFIGVAVLGAGLFVLLSAPSTGNLGAAPSVATDASTPPGSTTQPDEPARDRIASAPGLADVEFFTPPEDAVIAPGDDVHLSGSVRGLGADELHIVARPDSGGSYYPVPGTAASEDGVWKITHHNVGDESDQGRNIAYLALQANPDCRQFLATTDKFFKSLRGTGCEVRELATVRVR